MIWKWWEKPFYFYLLIAIGNAGIILHQTRTFRQSRVAYKRILLAGDTSDFPTSHFHSIMAQQAHRGVIANQPAALHHNIRRRVMDDIRVGGPDLNDKLNNTVKPHIWSHVTRFLQYNRTSYRESRDSIPTVECRSAQWRQQFYPAVSWDTNINQPSVPSYSRIQLLPPQYDSTVRMSRVTPL